MKFYRVRLYNSVGASAGFAWTTSDRDARRVKRKHKWTAEIDDEPVEIDPTRAGILLALKKFASHSCRDNHQ